MKLRQLDRLMIVLGAAAFALILLVGWVFVIGPQNSKTSSINSQSQTVDGSNQLLQARLDTLRTQNQQLGQYEATLQHDQAALPSTSGLSDFLRELQNLGASTLVQIQTVAVSNPTPPPAAAATPSAGSTAAAPSTGVISIGVSVDATGSAAQLTAFVNQLQTVESRAVLISSITLEPNAVISGTAGAARHLHLVFTIFSTPVAATATPAPAVTAN